MLGRRAVSWVWLWKAMPRVLAMRARFASSSFVKRAPWFLLRSWMAPTTERFSWRIGIARTWVVRKPVRLSNELSNRSFVEILASSAVSYASATFSVWRFATTNPARLLSLIGTRISRTVSRSRNLE